MSPSLWGDLPSLRILRSRNFHQRDVRFRPGSWLYPTARRIRAPTRKVPTQSNKIRMSCPVGREAKRCLHTDCSVMGGNALRLSTRYTFILQISPMSVFTPEEISCLQNQRLARIATVGRDGQPHNEPVGLRYNPDTDKGNSIQSRALRCIWASNSSL
jgi:hypothetical protein